MRAEKPRQTSLSSLDGGMMLESSSLTPKREKFAQNVAAGMTQADAYRASFDASKSTDKMIHEEASRLMAIPKVATRIEELRKPIIEKVFITLEGHLADLKTLRNLAARDRQYSAAVNAEIARAKHAGITLSGEKPEISTEEIAIEAQRAIRNAMATSE